MTHDADLPGAARELDAMAQRRHTPCGDGQVVWRSWGEGEPMVMLHGGSGSWTHWLRNIPAVVAAGRQAVVPDLPGFGDSATPPGRGDADAAVGPLVAGFAQLFGSRAVDVVGFSFGSLVAALLASGHPDSIARLVLVGAPVTPLRRGRGVELRSWNTARTPQEREAVHRYNLAAIMLHRPESIDDTAVAIQSSNVPRDRMRGRSLVTTTAFQEAIARFQCPYRAIYGAEDVLFKDAWPGMEGVLTANPHFEGATVIPRAGHWVQFEEAGRFNEALLGPTRPSRSCGPLP